MLRKTFWCLQECCKCPEELFSVCNTVASHTKNFLAFATPLQVPRKIFWRLQHCCKSPEKLFGVCNTVASPMKNFLAFATLLQAFPKTFCPSRGFRRNALLDLCLDPECTYSRHANGGALAEMRFTAKPYFCPTVIAIGYLSITYEFPLIEMDRAEEALPTRTGPERRWSQRIGLCGRL